MGTIAVRQRRITTELVSHGWPGSEGEARDALLELLPYAVGVATAREEVVCLSKLLKLHIDDWTGDEIYLRLLYRQRRLSLEDYEQFAAAAPIAEQWCRATLDSFRTQLIESHPNSAGLFLAATQSRLAAYSLKAAHQWPAVTEALAVPESVIGPFSSACRSFATVNDWGPVLQSLDYRMVRWLLEP